MGRIVRRFYFNTIFNRTKKEIKGKNNSINYNGSILSDVKFIINGNNNVIKIGKDCQLRNMTFEIRGDNHTITFGENTWFLDTSEIVFEDSGCSLTIGEDGRFWGIHIAVTEPNSKITIGNGCTFAYDVDMRTGDSHSILSLETGERLNFAKDILIGDRVWIAAHNIILKGVTIPDNSIVATGSIVTKKFKDKNVLIAGNPAKIIKEGVDWSRNRIN